MVDADSYKVRAKVRFLHPLPTNQKGLIKMRVIVTAGECLDRWVWDDVCKIKGYSEWAINEVLWIAMKRLN